MEAALERISALKGDERQGAIEDLVAQFPSTPWERFHWSSLEEEANIQ